MENAAILTSPNLSLGLVKKRGGAEFWVIHHLSLPEWVAFYDCIKRVIIVRNTADQTSKSNILHLEQMFGVKAVVHMLYYFCPLVHKKGNIVLEH